MNELSVIEATYTKLARLLDLEIETLRVQSDFGGVERLQKQQLINDSAYFVLAWGQLESKIDEVCEAAIRRRQASVAWEDRRAWDALNADRLRLRFEDRVGLVLDRSGAAYRKTLRYYHQRNPIAHGRTLATSIDVPFVIGEFYAIWAELTA